MSGVIEGFYGQPWSAGDRAELFGWMSAWGLNTYVYAPKDDLKHRVLWRELYTPEELAPLRALIDSSREGGIRFVHAIGPGLDIRYNEAGDLERLRARLRQMLDLGCRDFALLFDDIPDQLAAADRARWGSFAAAQCHVTNTLFQWFREQLPDGRFLFCPTPYCDRMEKRQLGGAGYLETAGRELAADIDVFWTGPEIVSGAIQEAELAAVSQRLRRPPVLWDNLHANDYDRRRFHCGPCAGRPPAIQKSLRGWLLNPNCEFLLNYVPLRTLGACLQASGNWDPRQGYLEAMREWSGRFDAVRQPLSFEELVLFGDCFYLPYEEGAEAERLYQEARQVLELPLAKKPAAYARFQAQANRMRDICGRLAELRDRPLFHALSRFAWELREELDLLLTCLRAQSEGVTDAADPSPGRSDFHLPGTYRGGLVARLQRLLVQHPDGSFTPAPTGTFPRA
jgi:protein O-GlcNAcase/histone acetyltransferase